MPPVMEAAHAELAEDQVPVEVAGLELAGGGGPGRRCPARGWPKPRSVKLRPLRKDGRCRHRRGQRMKSVATPPCRMKSSMRWPTSLSTKAVQTAVRRPKHLRRPRATLYSPRPPRP